MREAVKDELDQVPPLRPGGSGIQVGLCSHHLLEEENKGGKGRGREEEGREMLNLYK